MGYCDDGDGTLHGRVETMGAMMDVQPPKPPHLHDQCRYRAFLLDADGNVVRTEHLFAETDEAALTLASELIDGHAVEVWDGLRFLEHFDALAGPAC